MPQDQSSYESKEAKNKKNSGIKSLSQLRPSQALIWIEDWPVTTFLFLMRLREIDHTSQEKKTEVLLELLRYFLIARDAFAKKIPLNADEIKRKTEIFQENVWVQDLLKQEWIQVSDIQLLAEIEYYYEKQVSQWNEEIRRELVENPERIADLYENNKAYFIIKNALHIVEYTVDSDRKEIENSRKDLGVFSPEDMKEKYPENGNIYYKTLKEKKILFPQEEQNKKWIVESVIPEYTPPLDKIKEKLLLWLQQYLLEEKLEEGLIHFMDLYSITYEEESIEYILKTSFDESTLS